ESTASIATPTVTAERSLILLSEKSSGSSVFQREICKTAGVHHVQHSEHYEHETLFWLKSAILVCPDREKFLDGTPKFTVEDARKKLRALICENCPEFQVPDSNGELVEAGWAALRKTYAPVFFEKSPHHLQNWAALETMLETLRRLDDDFRIVALVRNPLDVLHSAWARWQSPPETRQHVWRQSHENLLRLLDVLPAERLSLIHYEDLATNPVDILQHICRFAGLPYDPSIGRSIHSKSVNRSAKRGLRWKLPLPRNRKQPFPKDFVLAPEVRAVAREFGYCRD
ncbi:MAG: sulfotransferase, partial [Oricola sp.]